jgi:hypothetical protein
MSMRPMGLRLSSCSTAERVRRSAPTDAVGERVAVGGTLRTIPC